MPQMAPISWIFMFTFFIISLFLFTTLNYYSFNTDYMTKTNQSNKMKSLYSWKW